MEAPKAKKSLGQNFLQDKNIASKIVEAAKISQNDFVLEIGPGPGMLTSFIRSKKPNRLVLIEKDSYWATDRFNDFSSDRGGVILTDALTMPWEKFSFPCKFLGNLPYNVASPLMWDILAEAKGLTRAVFMVQKEVGQRLVAKPNSKAYGALSVWVQCHSTPTLEFIVPPHVFKPRPKVDSAVLSFVPLSADKRPQKPQNLSRFLKMMFQNRRKQLGGIFRTYGLPLDILDKVGAKGDLRPENLSPLQINLLSEHI